MNKPELAALTFYLLVEIKVHKLKATVLGVADAYKNLRVYLTEKLSTSILSTGG